MVDNHLSHPKRATISTDYDQFYIFFIDILMNY